MSGCDNKSDNNETGIDTQIQNNMRSVSGRITYIDQDSFPSEFRKQGLSIIIFSKYEVFKMLMGLNLY